MKKNIFFFSILLLASSSLFAQWKKIASGISVKSFTMSRTKIFAGCDNDLVYCSNDSGKTWTLSIHIQLGNGSVVTMSTIGDTVVSGSSDGTIFISTNNGENWHYVYSPTDYWRKKQLNCLAFNDTDLYAGSNKGVYRTGDLGSTWDTISNNIGADAFVFRPDTIFTGSLLSIDGGKSWVVLRLGSPYCILYKGSDIYEGSDNGMWISHNNGIDWIEEGLVSGKITSFATIDSNIYYSSSDEYFDGSGGVFLSKDKGATWTNINFRSSNADFPVNALLITNGKIFAGRDSGIWIWDTSKTIDNSTPIDSSISLFPNPTFALLTIRNAPASAAADAGISIVNVLGQVVLETRASHSAEFTVDLSSLPAGIYYARVLAGSTVEVRKIVKE